MDLTKAIVCIYGILNKRRINLGAGETEVREITQCCRIFVYPVKVWLCQSAF